MAIQLIQLPSISQASDSSAIGLRDFRERFHSPLRERVGERVGGEAGGGRTPMRDTVVATSQHGVEFSNIRLDSVPSLSSLHMHQKVARRMILQFELSVVREIDVGSCGERGGGWVSKEEHSDQRDAKRVLMQMQRGAVGAFLPSFLYLSSLPTHFLHATFARRRRDVVRADSEINLSGATAAISFNLTASENQR